MTIKKRRGRPTKPAPKGKRASLGLKVTAATKEKLEAAAESSGRTQSQEAEYRIERSFSDLALLDALGPPEIRRVAFEAIANFVFAGQRYARENGIKGDWLKNQLARWNAVTSGIGSLLENFPNDAQGDLDAEEALAHNSRRLKNQRVGS